MLPGPGLPGQMLRGRILGERAESVPISGHPAEPSASGKPEGGRGRGQGQQECPEGGRVGDEERGRG